MKRQLLLLRHGKSDWQVNTDDFNRPLKKRGKRGAICMGMYLQQQDLQPDFIVSSPAVRALNTAEKLCKAMGIAAKHIHQDETIYAANLFELIKVLANCPSDSICTLLIGHNPGLEDLLLYLHDGPINIPEDDKLLATATLAVLNMPDNWKNLSRGCAKLLSITRASSLF